MVEKPGEDRTDWMDGAPRTGLLDREAFSARLCESIARARRSGEPVAVVRIGLEVPDAVDEPGACDDLLRRSAESLRRSLREGDPLARLGSTEFVAVVHQARADRDLGIVARRLLDELASPVPGRAETVGASIGIALHPGDGSAAEVLLEAAETAMYQARSKGGRRFHFYEKGVDRAVANRLRLEDSLRHAIERDELMIHYQPQLDLAHREFSGVEALLRWRNEEGGMAAPASFLPAAEGIGLMGKLGEWVLRNACRELADLKSPQADSLQLSVNVSREQLVDPQFNELVLDTLGSREIDPRRLELDVDEALLGAEALEAGQALARLQSRGVRIALDGFGRGSASLQLVRKIRLDTIKIDRSLIQAVDTDPAAQAIVAAVATLCERLHCRLVAVGVEREEQVRTLAGLGCDRMQGFVFSTPVPIERLARILERAGGARSGGTDPFV